MNVAQVDPSRAGFPQHEQRRHVRASRRRGGEALSGAEPHAVYVARVVPEVERRLEPGRNAPHGVGLVARLVVRLARVDRRHRPLLQRDHGIRNVEPAPAAEPVAQERALAAAVRRVHVLRRVLEQGRHLLRTQIGADREEQCSGGRDERGRERGSLGEAVLDHDIPPFDVTEITEPLAEGLMRARIGIEVQSQIADPRRLLRRDAGRRKQRDNAAENHGAAHQRQPDRPIVGKQSRPAGSVAAPLDCPIRPDWCSEQLAQFLRVLW